MGFGQQIGRNGVVSYRRKCRVLAAELVLSNHPSAVTVLVSGVKEDVMWISAVRNYFMCP
jgi:hypothetical protein